MIPTWWQLLYHDNSVFSDVTYSTGVTFSKSPHKNCLGNGAKDLKNLMLCLMNFWKKFQISQKWAWNHNSLVQTLQYERTNVEHILQKLWDVCCGYLEKIDHFISQPDWTAWYIYTACLGIACLHNQCPFGVKYCETWCFWLAWDAEDT